VADSAPVRPDGPGDAAAPDSADSASADATDAKPSDSGIATPDALYVDSGKTPADGGCWSNGQCFTVGGTVTGAPVPVMLADNGSDALSSAGQFTFPTALPVGASYKVTVAQQPVGSFCVVSNGSGKIVGSNVTNVMVNCANKVVFVTSAFYSGSLGSLGGVTAGDNLCMAAAATEPTQLTGTFQAWLSDDNGSPSTSFAQSPVPYVRLDGTVVAFDWAHLISALSAPIDVTETGSTLTTGSCVWTGTKYDGTSVLGDNCANWTSAAPSSSVVAGSPTSMDALWSLGCAVTCADGSHLYCFQQ
jgi:hypothetical protein